MKQKTIIQVWGAQDRGKSGTIKIIREELIRFYINTSHTYSLPLPSGEISDVLICNGIKVGIESMGDYLWHWNLHDRLNAYILQHNCDIIICASRVYNDVSKHIEHLANTHNYRLLKVTNYRGEEFPFVQDELNQLSAQHLLNLVDQIITGRI
ncbi:hypothetical protein [Moheibacter sediminis]|uniref:Uncharacterized protein n=1 Tax=Moheibacter sediminis TaxID=1434700 RepID=A0A1W2AFI9_9FLAO|nr:hypothetical protein [Moheibacter sediminis]SMC59350.1 hypothetical protein SAMN06296427_104113 [Moheibacter sediminis]